MSLAIAFTTIERPRIARRFVLAVRKRFPNIPVYVADQSPEDATMSAFYAVNRVTMVQIEHDAGLSAARNRLMVEVREKYVWLCDDDYIFYGDTRFDDAVIILESHTTVGVVGARVFDLAGDMLRQWHWEFFLNHDERNRLLSLVPIYHVAPLLRRIGKIEYYLCDTVHNCAIFRRSIFDGIVKWDDQFKINAEHEDFYINMKRNSTYRVAYLPTLMVFHRPDSTASKGYNELRGRMEFWRYFKRKWGVDQLIEIGAGVWRIDDSYEHLRAEDVAERFYGKFRGPLSRRQASGRTEATEIETASPLGGAPPSLPAALFATTAPQPVKQALSAPEALRPIEARRLFDPTTWHVYFRYDPFQAFESDIVLWCSGVPTCDAVGIAPPTLELRARWFSSDDQVLIWETCRVSVQLSGVGEWRPVWLEAPLTPRGTAFLRFVIVAERASDLIELCCGFLIPGKTQGSGWPTGGDALALLITDDPPAGSDSQAQIRREPAKPLPEVDLPVERIGPADTGLLLLRLNSPPDVAALRFVNWPGAGKRTLGVRLSKAIPDCPCTLVIPDPSPSDSDPAVLAYNHNDGIAAARLRFAATPLPNTASALDVQTPGPKKGWRNSRVAVVVTSCGRQDLLEQTLDSFFAFNTAPITQCIVVEDGPRDANALLETKYQDRDITWLATGTRVGQIAAIDHAYAHVDSQYIFHLEDDWEFYSGGFIENSMRILQSVPDCLQVWIRALDDTNGHPLSEKLNAVNGVVFRKLEFDYNSKWHGFSFNPGLRRSSDYSLLGRYGWFADSEGYLAEGCLSDIYKQLGFFAAILADRGGSGYVKHIGGGRTVPEPLAAKLGGG